MPEPEPQPVLSAPTAAAIFLAATVNPGSEAAVRGVLADVGGLRRSVGFRVPDGRLSLVVGIGSAAWEALRRTPPGPGCIRSPRSPARATLTTCRSAGSGARSSARTSSATPAPDVIEQMLRNMFVGDPPGNHDRLLDFSTAVTGSLYFVPTVDFLVGVPEAAPESGRGGRRAGRRRIAPHRRSPAAMRAIVPSRSG